MKYFDIEKIQPKVEEYAALYHTDREAANKIFTSIYNDILSVVNGVLFTQRYHKYENVDELKSVAIEALIGPSGLAKFNPSYTGFKGKKENLLFSYISLISKRSMYFYTLRNKKYRETSSLYFDDLNEAPIAKSYEVFCPEDFIDEIDRDIRPKFENLIILPCYDYLIKYIKTNGRFNRKDFFIKVKSLIGTDENVISKVKDRDICENRANGMIRKTIKLYKLYLYEYLKKNKNYSF